MAPQREIRGAEEAQRAIAANRSPRYCRLNELERWVDTTQYDDRAFDWFADTDDAPPLRKRRPCIAYPVVRSAIVSNVDLCLGEGKFPAIVLSDSDDDSDGGEMDDSGRDTVDTGLARLIPVANLKPFARAGLTTAQSCGTSVALLGARDGVPFAEIEQAKRCEPVLDADGNVLRIEVRYPYTVERRQPDGSWLIETYLYRRVIDDQRDVTYLPAKALEDGSEPRNWQEDPKRTTDHGLGFCPAVWYAHMVAATTEARIDGTAIHAHCTDEIEALDIALSQWHRAAFYAGDPLIVETGTDDRAPMADGVGLGNRVPAAPRTGVLSDDNPALGHYVFSGWGGAGSHKRRKGPGIVWTYPSKDADAKILALPGDALKAIQDNARDLREKVAESLGVVFSDPDTVRFATALSGKAQQMLRQRQLDRCDQYRDDFGDRFLVPVVQMLLRVCAALGPGIKSAAIRKAAEAARKLGDKPSITLRWGDYYAPEPAEEKATAEALATIDKVVPLPTKLKLQKLARILDVENVDALLAEIEAEQAKRDEKEREIAESGARSLIEAAHGTDRGGASSAGGARAKADARGGGGTPPPAAGKSAPGR